MTLQKIEIGKKVAYRNSSSAFPIYGVSFTAFISFSSILRCLCKIQKLHLKVKILQRPISYSPLWKRWARGDFIDKYPPFLKGDFDFCPLLKGI
ncbi:MAG TPA: hypothetical protein DEP99_01340 [Nitrospiraceae bacterium]|nr:hypothetical protein [Nitrospiraceae bacterium]